MFRTIAEDFTLIRGPTQDFSFLQQGVFFRKLVAPNPANSISKESMPLDLELEKMLDAASQDIVRVLKSRSLYRIANAGNVLENLSERLKQDPEIEQLYQKGSAFTREINRQAHFAYFEEVYKMLIQVPPQRQVYQELARYLYRRAITCLYEMAPQYVSSSQTLAQIEFTRLASASTQAAAAHINERITWTGGVARPSNFYGYVNRTIRKQCADLLFQQVIQQAGPPKSLPSTQSGSAPARATEPGSTFGQDIFPPSQQRVSLGALLQATRRIEDPNQRAAAVLSMVGLDHKKVAAAINQSEQDTADLLSRVFEEWSSNFPVMEKLRGCFVGS